jgi:hypothetical protein
VIAPRRLRGAGLVVVCLVAGAVAASAQARRPPQPPRPTPHSGTLEIGGGFAWGGGIDFGSSAASLVRNPGTGAGDFDLFDSDSRLDAGIGFRAWLGVYVSPSLALEGGVRLLRPTLATELSGDFEDAADTTASETVNQYTFDGSLVWHFTGARFGGGRGVPFVAGGAGYLRDLHQGNELVETGVEYHATAGVKYWFSAKPRRAGVRGEAGVSVRDGGFDFGEGTKAVPIASVSIVYLF